MWDRLSLGLGSEPLENLIAGSTNENFPSKGFEPGRNVSATVDRVLQRLQGVKRNGSGWVARCPAHEDQVPSLSIDVGDDGRVLLNCFAGCEFQQIISALFSRIREETHGKDCVVDRIATADAR